MGTQPGFLRYFPDDSGDGLGDAGRDNIRRAGGAMLRDFPGGICSALVKRYRPAGDSAAGRNTLSGVRILGPDIHRAFNQKLPGRAGFKHISRFDHSGDYDFTDRHQYFRSLAAFAFASAERRRICAGRNALANHTIGIGTRGEIRDTGEYYFGCRPSGWGNDGGDHGAGERSGFTKFDFVTGADAHH